MQPTLIKKKKNNNKLPTDKKMLKIIDLNHNRYVLQ